MTAYRQPLFSLCRLTGYLMASGAVALWGGVFTAKVTITTFYAALSKPVWAPPGWVFGPVWTALYIGMSVAMWLVWKAQWAPSATTPRKAFASARLCWWCQLVLNAAWPVVFWLQPAGMAAFVVCALLAASVWLCTVKFWPLSAPAALLMLPYGVWVTFATALSCALWLMNRAA